MGATPTRLPPRWIELLARIEAEGERMPRGRGTAATALALVRRGLVRSEVPFGVLGIQFRMAATYTITEEGRQVLAWHRAQNDGRQSMAKDPGQPGRGADDDGVLHVPTRLLEEGATSPSTRRMLDRLRRGVPVRGSVYDGKTLHPLADGDVVVVDAQGVHVVEVPECAGSFVEHATHRMKEALCKGELSPEQVHARLYELAGEVAQLRRVNAALRAERDVARAALAPATPPGDAAR